MHRPTFDLADIVREHRHAVEQVQPLSAVQAHALSAITLCRTAALGGHQDVCTACGLEVGLSYNSCRNRHCPKCQALAQEHWIQARAAALLPVPHFHGVFTLPEDLRPLARAHPCEIYEALFRCARTTLLAMGRSRLGVRLGLTMVLHTWTRELAFHPHVHVLVTGGGLRLDGRAFKHARRDYLLPVKALARLFQGKVMAALRRLKAEGVFRLSDGAFGSLMATLARQRWVVYLKRTFHRPEDTLAYLGRYTHRVGISNSRLLAVNDHEIRFRTKDGRTLGLPPITFLRRFIQHILPDGFKKIRHAGLYASPKALTQAKAMLPPTADPPRKPTWQEALHLLTGRDPRQCTACGGEIRMESIPALKAGPPRIRHPRPRSPD